MLKLRLPAALGDLYAEYQLVAKDRTLRRRSNRIFRDRPFPRTGTVYRETEIERADLETIIADLMSGQFNDPIRVVAFNMLGHWSEDVTEYIAFEIQARFDVEGAAVPEHIRDFVESFMGPDRQLALRLV